MRDKFGGVWVGVEVWEVEGGVKCVDELWRGKRRGGKRFENLIDGEEVGKEKMKELKKEVKGEKKEFGEVEKGIDGRMGKMGELEKGRVEVDKVWRKGVVGEGELLNV